MNTTEYFPDYKEVGYVKKSYGVQGHVRFSVEEDYSPSIKSAEHCFFLLRGCLVPYFLDSVDGDLLKFQSCNSPEDTKVIASKAIYLHKEQVLEIAPKHAESFQIVKGFQLVNADSDEIIGLVEEVEEYPEQEIAIVLHGTSEFMIPLNEHNVKGINMNEQLIFVEIPEGLLDL